MSNIEAEFITAQRQLTHLVECSGAEETMLENGYDLRLLKAQNRFNVSRDKLVESYRKYHTRGLYDDCTV